MGFYIGIDLGTTYSVAAFVNEKGVPQIIQTTQASVTTPSAVYIGGNGELLIGVDAKDEQKHKSKVATFYKRTMGEDIANYYLEDGKAYSSIELSSIFLKEFARRIEEVMGKKIDGAVITVPAYFSEHEKSNTKKAAEKAGLKVLHMVNEPTAAAIAYGLDKAENKNILVYDLGGGTFDVSVANITKDRIKIIATIGDFQLGGKDWDNEICLWAAEQFEERFGDSFSMDFEQMDAIMVDAEKLKRNLTNREKADIHIKYEGNKGTFTLSEAEFRQRTRRTLERTGTLIDKMFEENNMSWEDIDDVILVGGSTRMPMVEDYIKEMYGKSARRGISPDEAVALGAALFADSIAKSMSSFTLDAGNIGFELTVGDKQVEDVNSHSLGLIVAREDDVNGEKCRIYYNEIMISKNTSLKDAQMTKAFKLNSDTQDIYLTQWEFDSLPEPQSIIGKYQVVGIIPKEPFHVTYFHKPDGTVDISAEQNGRRLIVSKVSDFCDRSFDPEPIAVPAKGAFMIAIDLSGSMQELCTDIPEFKDFMNRIDDKTLDYDELEEAQRIVEFLENVESERYSANNALASKMKFTAIGLTKRFIKDFVEKFPLDNVSFGIVGFADRIKDFCGLTHDSRTIFNAVDELIISEVTGICNGAQPMDHMFDLLAEKKREENLDFAYAVVLTDGYWESNASSQALKAKSRYISENIEIIVQGFGSAKEDFIKKLATLQEFSGVGDISQVGESLNNIAEVLSTQDFSLT